MGGLLSKHQTKPKDYERVLQELEKKIRQSEDRIAALRAQENVMRQRILTCGFILCTLSVLFNCMRIFGSSSSGIYDYAYCLRPVMVISFGMIYARRISQSFLRRSMRREGARLSKLRSERSLQLGELKNKLTYNSTLALIERYDSETANQIKTAAAAASSRSAAADGSSSSILLETLRHTLHDLRQGSHADASIIQTEEEGTPPQRVAPVMHPPPQRTEPPQELLSSRSDKPKTPLLQLLWWYSKLIDTLVGENESPENQYALICRHCYAHNGLYPREEIHRIQYTCPYCKQFNNGRADHRVDSAEAPSSD